MKEYEIDMRQ